MKGEEYAWTIVVMGFVGVGTVFGYLFLQDQEVRALNEGSPGNAAQFCMLKYTAIGAGIGIEALILLSILKTKLAERPKTRRIKLRVTEQPKPQPLKLRVVEPHQKKRRIKLKTVE